MRLTASDPNLTALLLDLRGHGATSSRRTLGPSAGDSARTHTLEDCARDVLRTVQALGLVGDGNSPVGAVGHSFGGRVALEYLHKTSASTSPDTDTDTDTAPPSSYVLCEESAVRPPRSTWILDSVPGRAHGSVAEVVEVVSFVPLPIRSRSDLVEELTERRGVDRAVAMWMTTNLTRSDCGGGFAFAFDLDVVREVLKDFPRQDFAGLLRAVGEAHRARGGVEGSASVNVVRAGRNGGWTEEIVSELDAIGAEVGHLRSHVLEDAGHWVHVDDLDGLMMLMDGSFD